MNLFTICNDMWYYDFDFDQVSDLTNGFQPVWREYGTKCKGYIDLCDMNESGNQIL